MNIILKMLAGQAKPGQQQWTTTGTYSFVVPFGVFSLSGVAVGGGKTPTGGGLHWRNGIPVVPGETLTVHVGPGDSLSSDTLESSLKRGGTYLLRADTSGYFATLGGGGGSGGSGQANSATAGGGGAGGYMGNGGNGGNPGSPPVANSGGGQGANPGFDGQGVGLQGRTATFAAGSLGSPQVGGGQGEGEDGGDGGVRVMWGPGRSYPDAAADV